MAAIDVSSMKVCDITQCSICLETYKDPKALPCVHTFCLQCLDKHCEDKEQEEVACPLCRKVFTIPPGGNKDLPNNFFILQLLQVNKSTGTEANEERSKQHFCELCSDAETEILSTSYCIECDQHICERCSMIHKKLKVSRSHQVIREADFTTSTEERMKLAVSYCDQHPTEQNRLYCNDCNMVTCHACLEDNHKKHDLTDVNKSAEKFRKQMNDDVANVAASTLKTLEKSKQLETDKSIFLGKIATTESEISLKYDQLISLIQSHKNVLMEELNVFKNKILKEAETMKDEIERQFVIRESFKRYCQEMMNKGTACHMCRTAHDLHTRAKELVKAQDEPDYHNLSEVEITFKLSPLTTHSAVKNFIGGLLLRDTGSSKGTQKLNTQKLNTQKLDTQKVSTQKLDTQKSDFTKLLRGLTVHHVMPSTEGLISGITVLGSEIFVVRKTSQVFVYKSHDFILIRNLTITGSEQLQGLVSCSHYNCLYALDSGQKSIYRYDLKNNATTNWSVGGTYYGLSVTKWYSILTTHFFDTDQIQEYTTHGSLISEISLDSSIDYPRHSVQLSTGNYAVCHVGKQRRVCIVDHNGCIIQSYGGPQGAGVGQLNYPRHLTVDVHDNVLVVDYNNHRVQLLSPTLNYLGDIIIPGYKLNNLYSLHFDELNNRLYIGESRMFVLDVEY